MFRDAGQPWTISEGKINFITQQYAVGEGAHQVKTFLRLHPRTHEPLLRIRQPVAEAFPRAPIQSSVIEQSMRGIPTDRLRASIQVPISVPDSKVSANYSRLFDAVLEPAMLDAAPDLAIVTGRNDTRPDWIQSSEYAEYVGWVQVDGQDHCYTAFDPKFLQLITGFAAYAGEDGLIISEAVPEEYRPFVLATAVRRAHLPPRKATSVRAHRDLLDQELQEAQAALRRNYYDYYVYRKIAHVQHLQAIKQKQLPNTNEYVVRALVKHLQDLDVR